MISFKTQEKIFSLADLTCVQKLVLINLAHRAGADGVAYPAQETIARDVGSSLSTIKRAMKALKNKKLIATKKRYCKTDLVTINIMEKQCVENTLEIGSEAIDAALKVCESKTFIEGQVEKWKLYNKDRAGVIFNPIQSFVNWVEKAVAFSNPAYQNINDWKPSQDVINKANDIACDDTFFINSEYEAWKKYCTENNKTFKDLDKAFLGWLEKAVGFREKRTERQKFHDNVDNIADISYYDTPNIAKSKSSQQSNADLQGGYEKPKEGSKEHYMALAEMLGIPVEDMLDTSW